MALVGRAKKPDVPAKPGTRALKPQPAGRPDRPKVFCIGFHKTGTTSVKDALKILDYRVAGPFGRNDRNIASTVEAKAQALVPQFDAFQDKSLADDLPISRPGVSRVEVHSHRSSDREVALKRLRALHRRNATDAGMDLRAGPGKPDR